MEKEKTPENYRKAMWPRKNALLCPKDQYEEGEGMGINEKRVSQIENYIGKLLYIVTPPCPHILSAITTPHDSITT